MEEKKVNTRFKTFRKVILRTLLVLLLLLIVTAISLTFPYVQTKIAQYLTGQINKDYKTDINVEQVEINIFGGVQLKNVLVKDEKKDTLIFSKRIITSILDFNKLIDGKLIFGKMTADELILNIKTYKGDKDTNLDKFVAAFDNGKPSSGNFRMTSEKITLNNCRFREIDYNREVPLDVDFTKLNAVVTDFKVIGPNVYTNIDEMSFLDHRGLFVEDVKSKFTYTKQNIRLEKTDLKTKDSHFKGDVILKYDRKDFADFNNKVIFDINTEEASISSNDIWYFYEEIGKGKQFDLKGILGGTLNNFFATNLHLKDARNSEIIGDVNFKNLFAKKGQGEFYMKGSFDKVASSYDDLTALLPNVLGKKLPSSLKKIGKFNLKGDAEITPKTIDADFDLATILGNVKSQLVMSNIDNIDNASYSGNIALDNFDLGTFLNRKDVGKVTLDVDVDGKGFTEKYLNTSFSGEIKNINYNGYNYKNILADGSFKKPIFKGKINVNDPNLFLDFNGIVDLSKKENIYDFHAKVDYVNLKKLHFIKDSIAVFRGDVVMKVSGSNLNNLKGDVFLTNASYQNSKDVYFFDNLTLSSHFNQFNERNVTVTSKNEFNAEIKGKFDYDQIQKMVQNSLGSLYTNFKPNKLRKGQYLKFNFSEFNKIVEIFAPKIAFDKDAILNGSINSDNNDFKLNFSTKNLDAYDNHLDNVQLEIDNKNPLYNTYVQIDSVKTKYYKVRDFSLINSTSKDTLSFRTEFKGGEKGQDFYNLNLYHTINKQNKNVIGINKSEMMFKDVLWNINEKNEKGNNKITFDKGISDFTFEDFIVSHENQFLKLNGFINGKNNKDLELTFHEVDLSKITPTLNKFSFEGKLDGLVNIKQNNSVYQPTATLDISKLVVNSNELGNLNLEIEGDENFRKFTINSTIENENFKSLKAVGTLDIVREETIIDLDLDFEKFNLGILSSLGGDVISNIRGFISGKAKLSGNVNDINYTGKLFVDDAGLKIPYLNVDYKIVSNSVVNVTKNKFIIQPTEIEDTKFNTKGNLKGFIKHKQFGDWELDLAIDSKRILALNTKDHEDAAYFGTAFINGEATIKGPTDGLEINVTAESAKGTDIKIPINDASEVSDNNYIHFVTKDEKLNRLKSTKEIIKNYNGLQMNFDFKLNKNASVEVILDRDSGHGMKGVGEGGLLFRINTMGNFNMWGDYVIEKGTYNFKYGGIIDKKFDVKKNGSIVWEGNPYKAILDLEAVYKTTANPDLLLGTPSLNKKIPVEVVIDVKGTVTNPEPDFNINFPNISSVLKSEIETKLNDKDTRQTQALYLLGTGGFISQEGLSNSQYTNFAIEKAGALFSDIFNDEGGKTQIDLSYLQADKTQLNQTDSRVVASISTKVNDRITLNGKVGVPVGGVNQSTVIGNVEIQYRVNDDGTLNLRFFNKENDINYIGQGIGYTQGLGISYEVDFDTFNELVKKIFKKKVKDLDTKEDTKSDSQKIKEDKDKKEKEDSTSNLNKEAKPNDD